MSLGPHAALRRTLHEIADLLVDALEADARRAVEDPRAEKLPRRKPKFIHRSPPPPPIDMSKTTPELVEAMSRRMKP
jgi:hypothetical protein